MRITSFILNICTSKINFIFSVLQQILSFNNTGFIANYILGSSKPLPMYYSINVTRNGLVLPLNYYAILDCSAVVNNKLQFSKSGVPHSELLSARLYYIRHHLKLQQSLGHTMDHIYHWFQRYLMWHLLMEESGSNDNVVNFAFSTKDGDTNASVIYRISFCLYTFYKSTMRHHWHHHPFFS